MNTVASDPILRDRMIAAAAEAGIPSPSTWVDERRLQLVSTPGIDAGDSSTTVAGIWEYQMAFRAQNPPPSASFAYVPLGGDPSAITDNHIRAAVDLVASV